MAISCMAKQSLVPAQECASQDTPQHYEQMQF